MSIASIQEEIIKEFDGIDEWDEKYAKIIKMGRELSEFPEDLKTDKNKLDGCQSQVWTHAELQNGKVIIMADSDAMIVKGLIALVLKVYSGHAPDEILNSPPEFITKIGIDNHLSPTRKNGLGAMLKQIQMYAVAFKALASKM